VGLLALWQWASSTGRIDSLMFSRPTDIWREVLDMEEAGELWPNLRSTVQLLLVGWVLATVIGISLGVLIGRSRLAGEIISPFLTFLNAAPRLLLLPLLLIILGFGPAPKIVLVVSVVVVVVIFNVAAGTREIPEAVVNHARLLGARRRHLFLLVYLPAIALWIGSTARVTVGYAFNGIVAAELIGANSGLGFLLTQGQATFRADTIFASLFIMAVLAVALDQTLAQLERRATRWMPRPA